MKLHLTALAFAALLPTVALSEIIVEDAYMRVSRPGAPVGAAFMQITNTGDDPVRLAEVRSEAAARAELHTHIDAGDGVMLMRHVEAGFEIGAGETLILKRGGHHVMLMGLSGPYVTGDSITLTLVLETGDEVPLEIDVDNERLDLDP